MHRAVSTAPGTEPQCLLFFNIVINIITQNGHLGKKHSRLGHMYHNVLIFNDALDVTL